MKVREIMSTDITTIRPSNSLQEAEMLMDENRIRHLPVLDGSQLVGIVTQRDVLAALPSSVGDFEFEDEKNFTSRVRIEEIMHSAIETITPDLDVAVAAEMLEIQKIGCLLVQSGKKLVGIITENDFVRLARKLLEAQKLE